MEKTWKEIENILNTFSQEKALLALKKEYDLNEGDKIYEVEMCGGYWPRIITKNNAKYVYAFLNSIYFIDERDADKKSDQRLGEYGDFLRS